MFKEISNDLDAKINKLKDMKINLKKVEEDFVK
jgi:hypothetical protein